MAKKLALGVIVGAVAGVVAGVLTAPKSGKETRADIAHKAEELKDQATKAVDDTKHKVEDLTSKKKK